MTPEEKRDQMARRNADICAYYQAGHKLSECASHFMLGRQRVMQIVKQAGIWRPYAKSRRTKFLGISVTEATKTALEQMAEQDGVSVSRLTSNALDALVKP